MAGQLFLEAISFLAEVIDFAEHSAEEQFGRGCRNPGPLKLENFLPLSKHLNAHVFDFSPDEVEVCHVPSRESGWDSMNRKRTSIKPLGLEEQ